MTDLYTYSGYCDRVVDGDTVDLIVDLGFGVSKKIRIRLNGIDTPEKYGRATKAEKDHGQEATDFVKKTLCPMTSAGALVYREPVPLIIKTHKDRTGKYGRYIADITIKETGEDLATLLRDAGFAKRENYNDDDSED